MDVTYIAETCFRLRGRDASVVIAPTPAAMTQDADLALLCTPGADLPPRIRARSVLADPGEFELGGVLVQSFATYAGEPGGARNLIWLVELDRIVVCHLGALGHALDDETVEAIGSVDVLMVPVGTGAALRPDGVAAVVGSIEPRFVVPYTAETSDAAAVRRASAKVLAEIGLVAGAPKPKLALSRSAVAAEAEPQFVLLEPKKA